ncbi:hypothetical protein [Pseudoduganella violaceinigra]|uniref:hypothetical protein n=1 Tax=Pseudoduganella violaceinigra TaxID=246602 RepID=UPI000485A440|nr:hypothetical protein [Pseudoduganella violaceinigra]
MKAVFIVASLMAAELAGNAAACTCAAPTLAEEVAESKYVYVGTVMRVRLIKGSESPHTESTILVHRIAKGEMPTSERVVTTPRNMCSTPLLVGRTYSIFEDENGNVDAYCGRTSPLHRANEDEFIRKVKEASDEK